ncbi:hypothetical protein BJY52DRAFT_447795 [Lactarius psammicola]|nr:hypothetical protein BJY52DRAFT_447795 [Lactarius psammicola]
MFRSSALGLLALLRGIRSIGHTLKSFIFRFLLFWPRVLRGLRRIWSLSPGTGPKDVPKKKGGQTGPSFPVASGACEGYSAIYASHVFNRAGEPHLPLRPGNAEDFHLSPMMGQSQSVPQSPASSRAPSLPGSPQRSDRQLPVGSTPSIVISHNADSTPGTRQITIRHVNTPLTLTHSRVTSTQFAGAAPARSRSPSLFSSRSRPPSPNPSPSPSPSPSPHPRPLLQSSTQESSGSTQIPNVVTISQDTPEGSRQSSFDIRVSPPSRSQTLELNIQSILNTPQSPLSSQHGHLPGLSQSPTAESERSTQGPSEPRDFGSPYLASSHGNAHHSSGSLLAGAPTPSLDQARFPFPRPFASQVSVVNIPVADASGIWSDRKTRSIRLMHSEQVSRYVNKGDISPVISEYRLGPTEIDLPQ